MNAATAATRAAQTSSKMVASSALRRSLPSNQGSASRTLRRVVESSELTSGGGAPRVTAFSRQEGPSATTSSRYHSSSSSHGVQSRGDYPIACMPKLRCDENSANASSGSLLFAAAIVAMASASLADRGELPTEAGGWPSGIQSRGVQCRSSEGDGTFSQARSTRVYGPTGSTPKAIPFCSEGVAASTETGMGTTTAVTMDGARCVGGGETGGARAGAEHYADVSGEHADERRSEDADDDMVRITGVERRFRNNFERGAEAAAAAAAVAQADSAMNEESPSVSITDIYRFDSSGQPVGKGHRSTVFECTHRLTGKPVAVKRISRTHTSRFEVLEEVRMLQLAGAHPNVVTMQAFFEDEDAFYIVMDLCKGGELYHRLADKGRYSEGQAARIMAEIAEAVRFLHNHGIVHFDLKPENIMLAVGEDCVPEVRLADFGSAFVQPGAMASARAFTRAYSAPEVLAREAVDEKVDMWALGVVMWILLTGRHPFDTNVDLSEQEMTRRVLHEDPDFKCRELRHVSPEGKDLVRRLLAKDPEDRPSAREMLSHPWFRAVISRSKAPVRRLRGLEVKPNKPAASCGTEGKAPSRGSTGSAEMITSPIKRRGAVGREAGVMTSVAAKKATAEAVARVASSESLSA